jgi:hypothetical protein
MARILMEPPCPVRCIIDDNPKCWGKSLWNFPIVSRDEALRLGVDAVVLSSDSMEQRLFDNSALFIERGIEVLRLYPPEAQSSPEVKPASQLQAA